MGNKNSKIYFFFPLEKNLIFEGKTVIKLMAIISSVGENCSILGLERPSFLHFQMDCIYIIPNDSPVSP